MVAESLEEKIDRAEKMAQRALDIHEIQNVISLHSLLDAHGKNREQFYAIWAQEQPDVCWINNHGMWIGKEKVERYYCDIWDIKRKERLEQITKLYPQLDNDDKNDLVGWMKMHTNCTPIIEVAGDGKTAKGMFDSPGFITELIDGKVRALWLWERFAVDFIREKGKWKIWHFNPMVQFITPFEDSWVETTVNNAGLGPDPREIEFMDKRTDRNIEFSPERLCGPVSPNFPKPPEPYETFSETFSYGPD